MPRKNIVEAFDKAVFEFARRISRYDRVGYIVVFGSVAKGKVDGRSDIDVLVVLDTEREPDSLQEYEKISDAALDVGRDFDKSIQLVITNKRFSGLDEFFVENALAEGRVVYGKNVLLESGKVKLEPYYIVTISLGGLKQSDKMRVKRRIHGRVSKRIYKGREYISEYEGMIRDENGVALGRGCILIPTKSWEKFERVFREMRVKYWRTNTWISSYNIPKSAKRL